MSIEIFPTELPRAASEHFSTSILPYITALAEQASGDGQVDVKLVALDRATLVNQGCLSPPHSWLGVGLSQTEIKQDAPLTKRQVLLLGSGYVESIILVC